MPARTSLESVALAALTLACLAFVVSFALGIGGPGRSTAEALPESPALAVPDRSVGRVEVLNASGRAGLARAVTERLRDGGFDVVYYGNASGFDGDSSVVLDRTGDDAVARAAARHLGITSVRTQRDTTLYLDATIVLGRDRATAGESPTEPAQERWWTRVGRWFRPTR